MYGTGQPEPALERDALRLGDIGLPPHVNVDRRFGPGQRQKSPRQSGEQHETGRQGGHGAPRAG